MTNPKDSSEKSPQGSRPRPFSGEAPPTPPPSQQETESPNPRQQPQTHGSHISGDNPSTRRSLPIIQMTSVHAGDAGGSGSSSGDVGGTRPWLIDAGESPPKKRVRDGTDVGSGSSSGSKSVQNDPDTQRSPFACSVCSRSFQTAKALHGHMRAHSERGWRGTYPPPTFSPSDLDRDFKRTMDIVGGRGSGSSAAEAEMAEVLAVEEAIEEDRGNTPPPPVAEVVAVEEKVEWNLNELPKESTESTQAEEASTSQAAPTNKLRADGKLLDLNDLPPPDSDED